MYSIVYVNYKNSSETVRSIESFISTLESNQVRIFVVDNGSGREPLSILRKNLDGIDIVEIISLQENVGFSKGVNAGLRVARQHNYTTHFIVNPDTRYTHRACVEMLRSLQQLNIDVISPLIVDERGCVDQNIFRSRRKVSDYIFKKGLSTMLFKMYQKLLNLVPNSYNASKEQFEYVEGDVISGAFFGIRDTFDPMITLDEDLFLYLEEFALAEQIKRLNRKTFIATNIKITHLSNAKSGDQNLNTKLSLERKSLRTFLYKYKTKNIFLIYIILLNMYLYHKILILRKKL